jgi:hypothetical protein
MNRKLTMVFLMTLLMGTICFANSVTWSFERQIPQRIPQDQFVPLPFEDMVKSGDYCEIFNDANAPAFFFAGFDSGMGFAVYMNPAQCGGSPYPFKITDVHFYLYAHSPVTWTWPLNIQINVRQPMSGDSCLGPDPEGILHSESFTVPFDSNYLEIGRMMNLSLSSPYCLYEPFFLEIIYTDHPEQGDTIPSMLMDSTHYVPDTCDSWAIWSDLQYYEWYDFWAQPSPGNPIIHATGYAGAEDCDNLWYWKADKPDQDFPAPSGMPDFDQYQFGEDSTALCGPTALANCLWWYNAVPQGMTPADLIRLLCTYTGCDPASGTTVDLMQQGLDQYFIDYGFDLYEHTYYQPDFHEMEDSLKKSQDIILLLSFYQELEPGYWTVIGGHCVTMAGVCSESLKVALSDPARDMAVTGWPGRVRPPEHPSPPYDDTLHNDPSYVSQDIYISTLESPSPGNPNWGIEDYVVRKGEAFPFLGQNLQPWHQAIKGTYDPSKSIYTEVEYAIMICPGEWYWKPDKPTQEFPAPSGMPDFDQNQDEWIAYCGPVAVANCLWWYNAVPQGMTPPELIELLAGYFHTNPTEGTWVDTMEMGLEQYFSDYGFSLQESTFWMPDFYEMEDSLKKCQDIILLLGFWWFDGEHWYREGGHFVTMAGVHSEGGKVAFSDPDKDGAVMGQPGRVQLPDHPPYPQYPATLHNDPNYVSQDVYGCTINPEFPSPGSEKWEIDDYVTMVRGDYVGINVPKEYLAYSKPAPKDKPVTQWHTEVEFAVMICPKPSAVEDEEDTFTPNDFQLDQNYPNPFNNETVIKFSLQKPTQVSLNMYNILGQKVRTLVEGRMEAGPQTITWDGKDNKGKDLSSGIYFYQLQVGDIKQTKRLVLLK